MSKLNKGESDNVRAIFRFISDERRGEIDEYVLTCLSHNFQRFSSPLEIDMSISGPGYLTYEEASYIREYSGYNFRHLNQALRGRWSYEDNGNVSRKEGFLLSGSKIKTIIENHPTTGESFMAFRGVDLTYFKDYGIETLDDLVSLEGKFLLDKGFVSTSLLEDKCFFKKENELGRNYNIKIEYLIADDFRDGIYLGTNPNLTYCPDQYEYLINAGNMVKVAQVKINEDDTACLKAVVVPKHIYDDYYMKQSKREK